MSAITTSFYRTASNGAWLIAKTLNSVLYQGELPHPKWAPGPLLKSWQRIQMLTGIPRKTLSLCPECNREAVDAVLRGDMSIQDFKNQPGVIEAEILEESDRILMRKACGKHGPIEDVLSNHPAFFRRMESLAFGRDFKCTNDGPIHDHGLNKIETGRGLILTVDITNRCNMKCSPCFMDANAIPYVYELNMEDIKVLFENAASFKPQREINVLFSGGEATLSPVFLDAVRHARSMGFRRIQVATNGIRFAQDKQFAFECKDAGLHAVYLQLDAVSEEKNRLRGLSNYLEVRQRALENISAAGMRTTFQVTVTNGLNNGSIGDIICFAVKNIEKVHGVTFHPLMFSGRDKHAHTEDRYARRYPLSQLAYDLQEQTLLDWQPMRDWLPVSAYAVFSHLSDVLHPTSERGSLFPEPHPDHSIVSALLVNTDAKTAIPIPSFFNLERFMRDVGEITDSARPPGITKSLVRLSLHRNFNHRLAPSGFGPDQLREAFDTSFLRYACSHEDWEQDDSAQKGRWRIMLVAGMWFPDAFNYDLSVMQHSITPVATPSAGEVSFSAYYGAGWKDIVELRQNPPTLAEWHRKYGRHEIYAKGRAVEFRQPSGSLDRLIQIEPERVSRFK